MKVIWMILVFWCGSVQAQVISGDVKESPGLHLAGATASLHRQKDSVLIKAALTEDNGKFSLRPVPIGTYYLKISHTGFEDTVIYSIEIKSAGEILLPTVTLKRVVNTMRGLVVTARKPIVEVLPDKIVFNARTDWNYYVPHPGFWSTRTKI